MYSALKHSHSGLRWVVLVLLIAAIAAAWKAWSSKDSSQAKPDKMVLLALIFTHVQLLIGLILYFVYSPYVQFTAGVMKDKLLRFYTVEHLVGMLIAVVLITIGYSKGKRLLPDPKGHKTVFTFYLIGLVLILLSIPWPFRGLAAGWF
ncbi:MAG: hypothetical protein DHS20C18_33770 [Saprospiraceae bacterium]|nr:MAG: hypothetical protein DHS20C18_33770 [Saprospiraceae bacterium]